MRAVFLALAVTTTMLLLAALATGLLVEGDVYFSHHFALGLTATLFTCLTHCVVFTYFMATSKMMALAVEDASLDRSLAREALRHKLRAYRVLMPAITVALLSAVLGAWATVNPARSSPHLIAAMVSMLVQFGVFAVLFAVIRDNGTLMDRVFREHERARAAGATRARATSGA